MDKLSRSRAVPASFVCTIALPLALAACSGRPAERGTDPDPIPSVADEEAGQIDRSNRILRMAGEEAEKIERPKARLTRQLNIAHRQNDNDRPAEARATLAEARKTLKSAAPATAPAEGGLTDHDRLAGWVSIAELSRSADDPAAAAAACDEAVRHLNALQPVEDRPDYVPGVAYALRALRGDPAGAALLAKGGEWAAHIKDKRRRRLAYLALSKDLFECQDYEAARAVLRRDDDAAWRSDRLAAIADEYRAQDERARAVAKAAGSGFASLPPEPAPPVPPPPEFDPVTGQVLPEPSFGKPVDFRSTYYKRD